MNTKSHITAGLALAIACLTTSPAMAGGMSGSVYDPATGQTTTIIRGPGGSAKTVENGNTLDQHRFDGPRRPVTTRMSGSAFDPETNRTTTIIRGPRGEVRMVEPGNTLWRH